MDSTVRLTERQQLALLEKQAAAELQREEPELDSDDSDEDSDDEQPISVMIARSASSRDKPTEAEPSIKLVMVATATSADPVMTSSTGGESSQSVATADESDDNTSLGQLLQRQAARGGKAAGEAVGGAAVAAAVVFEVGAKVSARFQNKEKWYPGTIAKLREDGTCDIHYADGDKEKRVNRANVRAPEPPKAPKPADPALDVDAAAAQQTKLSAEPNGASAPILSLIHI